MNGRTRSLLVAGIVALVAVGGFVIGWIATPDTTVPDAIRHYEEEHVDALYLYEGLEALQDLHGTVVATGGSVVEAGLGLHCDGARIWHAHIADGVPLGTYGALFDTLSVCLSKGLGAPVGSVMVSSAERIARARVIRKRMGGGMRQVGILAAAGRYALANHIERLADDHARARRLAESLAPFGIVDAERVQTNIANARSGMYELLGDLNVTTEGINDTAYGLVQASIEFQQHVRGVRGKTELARMESRFNRAYLTRDAMTTVAIDLAREVALAA